MKKIVVLQEELSDCGVCSLLSIIRYYGGNTNLENLRIDSMTTNKGVNAYNLIECAKKNGFNAKGIRSKELNEIKLPAIVHFQINKSLTHFVTLYEINDKYYKIMDPSRGIVKLTPESFDKLFTGNIILLEPKSILPYKKNNNVVGLKIIKELSKQKVNILKLLFLNVLFIILSLISSYYIRIYNYPNYVIILSVMFILINIIIYLLSYFISKKIEHTHKSMSCNLIDNFFNYIFRLPLRYLHLKDPGEIVKRSDEVNLMNDVIINSLISIVINTLIIIIIIPFLENFYNYFILHLLIFILISSFITILTFKNIINKSKKTIELTTDYNNLIIDNIYGLTSIKHSKCEKYILSKLSNKLKDKQSAEFQYNQYIKKNETIRNILLTSFRLILNLYLINRIVNNNFTFENLIIFDVLLEIIINSINNVLSIIIELLFTKNLFAKANDFYNIPLDKESVLPFKVGDIKLKNLSYQIHKTPIFKKSITTNIKNGEKIIIKGESGCGKSTLCKIIAREIEDYNGQISIDNVNIKDINIDDFQDNVSYSSQSEKIFTGTIKENILLGREISEDKLEKIIQICKLERIINKKTFGLDTFLYGGGEELSGGERQLVILARALVRNFSILILDETLSEVNDSVEDEILKNLFSEYQDKTIIYVSHKNKKEYFQRTLNV